jgi:large subunit ribosomal protein L9
MKVILKSNVAGTGKAGDIVEVKDGFARNHLMPKNLAIEATKANMRKLEQERKREAEKIAANREDAEAQAKKLHDKKIEIKTSVGEEGKLFGSITAMDISTAVKDQLGVEVDKKKIDLEAPIKEAGSSRVDIKLFQDIKATIVVQVAPEDEE